jgi:hypothetical protein
MFWRDKAISFRRQSGIAFGVMFNRRFKLSGLFAVLLALMAQLGTAASVPRIDPVAGVTVLCHIEDETDGAPTHTPSHHSADCPLCPLCGIQDVQAAVLISDVAVVSPPEIFTTDRAGLPPPSTAPPARHRPPGQPRAPPAFS